jgi:predicted  nucleic acid-binding Zn-ribbon protein
MEEQTVDELLSLQELDDKIVSLTKERRLLQAERAEVESAFERLLKADADTKSRVESIESEVRRADRTVQAGRATLKRLQERAQELHRAREVSAARAEVDAARQNLDEAETVLLEEMQSHDRALVSAEEAEKKLTEGRSTGEVQQSEIDGRLAELAQELSAAEAQLQATAEGRDSRVRSIYERLSGGRTTQVLAPIQHGCCGHCFTSVPLQRQAEIRAGGRVVVCEGCGVILHSER